MTEFGNGHYWDGNLLCGLGLSGPLTYGALLFVMLSHLPHCRGHMPEALICSSARVCVSKGYTKCNTYN